jgi:hypothetical protein
MSEKKTVPWLLCNTNATRITDGSNPCLYHQNAANNHVSVAGPFNDVREIDLGNTLSQSLHKFWYEITQISTVNIACQTRSV